MTTGTTPTAATLKGTSTVRARCGGALATLALVLGVLTGVVPGSSAGATGPPPLTGITQITSGAMHSCALLNSGSVRCWGDNGFGQLATAPPGTHPSHWQCRDHQRGGHRQRLHQPEHVPCWLPVASAAGVGTITVNSATAPPPTPPLRWPSPTSPAPPASLPARTIPASPSATGRHAAGVEQPRTVGQRHHHRHAGARHRHRPHRSGGRFRRWRPHLRGLTDQSVRCWGSNAWGALGNGSSATDSKVPVMVSGISTATAISSGFAHTCATLTSGGVRCWGQNIDGQLGDGTTTDSTTPVAVSNITNATSVSGGYQHSCVRLADGGASCWGYNYAGLLGDGTTTDSTTPVTVSSLGSATKMAAGQSQSCALLSTGQGRCWGYNGSGQLGNGTIAASRTAVSWLIEAGITGGTAPANITQRESHTLPNGRLPLDQRREAHAHCAPHLHRRPHQQLLQHRGQLADRSPASPAAPHPANTHPTPRSHAPNGGFPLKANTCGPTTA
ncbi:MAG: hypothetical protein IPH38_20760 [Candidatus Microthrix sp.]|nr:hypothetical protein [Candidatus Microthrix sp.]